jgi:uncharacterized membrane protein YdjX (TVP38/TMEM64 family)
MDIIKKRRIKSIVILILIILVALYITYCFKGELVEFFEDPSVIKNKIDSYGVFGPLVFIILFVFQIVVAIIPGEPLEIAAGYAFGVFWGTFIVLIGTSIGSLLVFKLTRKFGYKFAELFISKKRLNSLEYLKDSKKLHNIIFTIFVIPGTPKDIFTYFVGLTNMSLKNWMILVTIARFPSIISSVIAGDAIVSKNSTLVITVFVITGLLSVIGLNIYNRFIERSENK